MLGDICAEIRNYFLKDVKTGVFSIENGQMEPLSFLQNGQYFRIVGSTFNDGVYKFPVSNLIDETFDGAVWAMAVPPSVVALAAEIEQWTTNESAKPSGFVSESFGNYSYTRGTNSRGGVMTWRDVFAGRLNKYRKVNVL